MERENSFYIFVDWNESMLDSTHTRNEQHQFSRFMTSEPSARVCVCVCSVRCLPENKSKLINTSHVRRLAQLSSKRRSSDHFRRFFTHFVCSLSHIATYAFSQRPGRIFSEYGEKLTLGIVQLCRLAVLWFISSLFGPASFSHAVEMATASQAPTSIPTTNIVLRSENKSKNIDTCHKSTTRPTRFKTNFNLFHLWNMSDSIKLDDGCFWVKCAFSILNWPFYCRFKSKRNIWLREWFYGRLPSSAHTFSSIAHQMIVVEFPRIASSHSFQSSISFVSYIYDSHINRSSMTLRTLERYILI